MSRSEIHEASDRQSNLQNGRGIYRSILNYKRVVAILLATGALVLGDKAGVYSLGRDSLESAVQARNVRLNHTFTIDELPQDILTKELIVTTLYEYSPLLDILLKTEGRTSKVRELIGSIGNFLRRVPQTGGVLLRIPDMQSVESIRESVGFIRRENPSAMIIMDFEGGYVRSPEIPESDLMQFGFPIRILELAKEEKGQNENSKLGQFPSAEFLGITYKSIKDEQKKGEFRDMMQKFGESLGKALASYGVNMILGPSLDVTDNNIGTNREIAPIAKNDRSYSDDPNTVSALGNSFIRGFLNVPGIIAVPKHFVGGGLTTADTDKSRGDDTNLRDGAILPFRDYVNLHEIDQYTPQQAMDALISCQPKGERYTQEVGVFDKKIAEKNREYSQLATRINGIQEEIRQTRSNKKLDKKKKKGETVRLGELKNGLKIDMTALEKDIYTLSRKKAQTIQSLNDRVRFLKEKMGKHSGKVPIIMTGNNDNNFYQRGIPGSLSDKTITAISKSLGATSQRGFGGMSSGGVIITDDLNAGAIRQYLGVGNASFSQASSRALKAGNTMLIFGDSLVGDIVQGAESIPRSQIEENTRRVLDLKVALGIYTKTGTRYTQNPDRYMPTSTHVSDGAHASRYWTYKGEAYTSEKGKIPEISPSNGIKNAVTNSILDICRIDPNMLEKLLCMMHPNMYDTYRAPEEDTLRKQLIIVDKKELMLYAYDLETREPINSLPIAIGKGTLAVDAYHDKQIAGDKKTPLGYYMVVQKKDPKRIRDTIEHELYTEYGGDDGGMLVLAGPWQPQIAIHGTKKESVGAVSSGCVRMDNETIRVMMDSVPLGSMVIITN